MDGMNQTRQGLMLVAFLMLTVGIALMWIGVRVRTDAGALIALAGMSLVGGAIGTPFRVGYVLAPLALVIGPLLYWFGLLPAFMYPWTAP